MNKKPSVTLILCLLCLAGMIACGKTESTSRDDWPPGSQDQPAVKPFRVLVIIGDQWTDPLSYNIDTRRVEGEEFIDVVTMLKIWGVPFRHSSPG